MLSLQSDQTYNLIQSQYISTKGRKFKDGDLPPSLRSNADILTWSGEQSADQHTGKRMHRNTAKLLSHSHNVLNWSAEGAAAEKARALHTARHLAQNPNAKKAAGDLLTWNGVPEKLSDDMSRHTGKMTGQHARNWHRPCPFGTERDLAPGLKYGKHDIRSSVSHSCLLPFWLFVIDVMLLQLNELCCCTPLRLPHPLRLLNPDCITLHFIELHGIPSSPVPFESLGKNRYGQHTHLAIGCARTRRKQRLDVLGHRHRSAWTNDEVMTKKM